MKILDKLKNMIFEDEEEQEVEDKKEKRDIKKEEVEDEEIAKKIDTEKSVKKPLVIEDDEEELLDFKEEEFEKGPIMFDDDDFIPDFKVEDEEEPDIKEDRILYGGYTEKKEVFEKEKFVPSPVISPVYGVLDKNYKAETKKETKHKSLDHLFVEERKKKIDLDSIREKAYGEIKKEEVVKEKEPEVEKDLLYDISTDDKPAVSNVTIGDAEEYYDDLGLEYNVDYKDDEVEKEKVTRSKKNKELADEIEEENKTEDIKQVEEIEEPEVDEIQIPKDDLDDMEEKNLYDLIDMMYDSKE